MDDNAIAIDQAMQMLALSITAALLVGKHVNGGQLSTEEAIARARRIVFDARTSAQAGNYR